MQAKGTIGIMEKGVSEKVPRRVGPEVINSSVY